MIRKAYKYKLNLTCSQKTKMNNQLGATRFVFNHFLNRRIEQYNQQKESNSKDYKRYTYNDGAKALTELKHTEDFRWLNEIPAMVQQQSLRHLESSYMNFFRQPKKGFPKFKSKKRRQDKCSYTEAKIDFDEWKLSIPKIGKVKVLKNKTFDISQPHKSMTISKDKCGD